MRSDSQSKGILALFFCETDAFRTMGAPLVPEGLKK